MDEIVSGVVADWSDARDADFTPASQASPPVSVDFDEYRSLADTTWHQRGEECTGFALAALANYSIRKKLNDPHLPSVSRRMLYEMAQKYDGQAHVEGSTLRGALKGWSRVGVAADELWPYDPDDEHGAVHGNLTLARVLDGRKRPLLSYQRIVGERIDTMKHALAENRPVYAAARTHVGWYRLFLHDAEPVINRQAADNDRGIHAFVVVGYNEQGFWIHNSWGPEWGNDGYALLPFDQWAWGAVDAWVVDAGIGAPPQTELDPAASPDASAARRAYREMWPHLVVLRDDGQLASSGLYEMDGGSVKTMLYLFDEYTKAQGWTDHKLAVIVDGGEFATAATIERLRSLRDKLLATQVYPIFVVWETPWLDDFDHELQTWLQHRSTGSDSGHSAAPSNLALQIAAAESRARAGWNEIIERSNRACFSSTGGARLLMNSITYKRSQRFFELHVASFGAGDLLASRLVTLLPTPITSAIAVAPATTTHRFHATYGEMLADGCLQHLTVLTDSAGTQSSQAQPDRLVNARRSLLQLVSRVWALSGSAMREAGREARRSQAWTQGAVPVTGIAACLDDDEIISRLRQAGRVEVASLDAGDYADLTTAPGVHDLVVKALLAQREPTLADPRHHEASVSRDPLAAAALLRDRAGY